MVSRPLIYKGRRRVAPERERTVVAPNPLKTGPHLYARARLQEKIHKDQALLRNFVVTSNVPWITPQAYRARGVRERTRR
jgi:hypothetical protein